MGGVVPTFAEAQPALSSARACESVLERVRGQGHFAPAWGFAGVAVVPVLPTRTGSL